MEKFGYFLNCLVIVLFIKSVSAFSCGSKLSKLQVHMVPHTHDDVGWLKTVDQYYYGSNRTIQPAAVQYILDTVVNALQQNPDRTFIYVEIAFFKRWWREQDDKTKLAVTKLVKNKQLEFINGGWSMNDEGAAHYNGIIDQMTLGLRFINGTFGPDARPSVAWHIDPFGHSAEQASLFSMMSFDGFFLGRIDYADKIKRLKEKRMEMVWQGSRNFKKATQIFTGVLYNNYFAPKGFCYDDKCSDPPIQDDPHLFGMNVKERVNAFVKETCKQATSYKTNNIILTMGEDFMYENAHRWFKNLDKLIHYVNLDGRINVFYSTPSRYLKALHDAQELWEVKSDDFFPYAHCPHCYWTGYFTSRPSHKGYIRESNNILQACKQVEVMKEESSKGPTSETLRCAMAVNQHHDAVTGTEKQHVANDYAKRLSIGRDECKELISRFVSSKYSSDSPLSSTFNFQYCDYLNISICHITEIEDSIVINVYNPIARPITSYLKIPVSSKSYVVSGSHGEYLNSQIIPVFMKTVQLRRKVKRYAAYELLFEVRTPPVGFATYFLNKTNEKPLQKYHPKISHHSKLETKNSFIENDLLRLEFSLETGRLVQMIRKDIKMSLNVDQQFFWYKGSIGNNESKQTSGAYIFRPNTTKPFPVCKLNKAKIEIIKGPLVEEARQQFGSYVSQVIRVYRGAPYAEFEHTVGPIPINDRIGKEIITSFQTSIKNSGVFYTDANGREMKRRRVDFRETWNLNITEPVSENYYPVNSRISINDSSVQFTVMTDRSQGGASIRSGEVELMLHRRLLKDDFLGVGEALNESGVDGRGLVTIGQHRVLLAAPKEACYLHRTQGEMMMMKPIVSFAANPYTKDEWKEKFNSTYSGLSRSLPRNIHLLTMETTGGNDEIILRFEHMFEKDEDPVFSKPTIVDLNGLFTNFKIKSIRETNLSANQYIEDKKRLQWNIGNDFSSKLNYSQRNLIIGRKFILKPMEIRTFIVNIRR